MNSLRIQLQEILLKYGVAPQFALQASQYGAALLDINANLNLTGAKTPEDLVSKHILDTYLAIQALDTRPWPVEIWDIGSGGGIPGILLAIFVPELRVRLVERRQKKCVALQSLVNTCELNHRVSISSGAFETFKPVPASTELWFRGFLPGPKLIQYLSQNFNSKDLGNIVLMKGPAWDGEKADALKLNKISPYWRQRFLDSSKIQYELPEGLGSRSLILL